MAKRTKKDILAENEELKQSNAKLQKDFKEVDTMGLWALIFAAVVLVLAVTLGVGVGKMNACPEQECRTLDKLYTLDQELDYYACYHDAGLKGLWYDIEWLTDFEHSGNPIEVTDVTVHYRYNTPQEADYIEGKWGTGDSFKIHDAKIYPNPPEWSYNSITIYPSGEDMSQTYEAPESSSGTRYYFRSFVWD